MTRNLAVIVLSVCVIASLAAAQNPRAGGFGSTRPPADNERGLRQLSPEEIPPNLNFYAMDPLYDPNAVLGWSKIRIEEKLNRGMLALAIGDGRVYLNWRLLQSDPQDVAFNVYRSTAGVAAVKINNQPIAETTDFVDDKAPLDQPNTWFVRPVVDGKGASPDEF